VDFATSFRGSVDNPTRSIARLENPTHKTRDNFRKKITEDRANVCFLALLFHLLKGTLGRGEGELDSTRAISKRNHDK
jgi:hypothetical protein